MLTLYSTPLSANGRKVLALARHLGIEAETRLVNVYRGEGRSPAYLAVNPSGRIPTLVDDDVTLFESNAILQYLAEAYGDQRLYSRAASERATISSWMFWESAHWQPALVPVLRAFVGHALLPDTLPPPVEPPDWNDETLAPLLARLETWLSTRPYLAGDGLSIADLSVAGMVTYFRAADFPFADHPAFARWVERIESLDAWRQTATAPWTSS